MPDTGRHYLDPKTLNKITRLDMRARLVVEGFISGLHQSPYNGFAIEFAQHRPYVPGDEIKHIDWKVWSKTDRYYIKEYEEDTNLKCTFLLDRSKSMRYGEHDHQALSKFDYGATLCACLAYLLQKQQDAAGLITFDNDVRLNLPASAHPSHMKLLVHELEQTTCDDRTDIDTAFASLPEQISRRGLVALVSDLFVDIDALTDALRHFRYRRHEVIVFHVMHADEIEFPFKDITMFKGLELDRQLITEPRALRKAYLQAKDAFVERVRRCCSSCGIDYVPISTADPLDAALSSYLAFRQRMLKTVRRA